MRPITTPMLMLAALALHPGIPLAQGPGNECTTVVLHAVSGLGTSCTPDFDCAAVQPRTRIDNPVGIYRTYMYLKNYDTVSGVQVAFDWPATWSFGFGQWQCQSGQLSATLPTAPGPIRGTIATAFDPISGGALEAIGYLLFNPLGQSGCLSIIESAFPFGNHVFNGSAVTPLLDSNEGRICSNNDGWNTCECRATTAVEFATWGQIKATY